MKDDFTHALRERFSWDACQCCHCWRGKDKKTQFRRTARKKLKQRLKKEAYEDDCRSET